jgi:hypothetical protein
MPLRRDLRGGDGCSGGKHSAQDPNHCRPPNQAQDSFPLTSPSTNLRSRPQDGAGGSRPFTSYSFHRLPGPPRQSAARVNPACYPMLELTVARRTNAQPQKWLPNHT